MNKVLNIGIFGGDSRQVYMAKELLDLGHNIASYGISEKIKHKNHVNAQTLNELFELSRLIIGPIPMSRDNASIFSSKILSDMSIAHVAYLLSNKHILFSGNIPLPIIELCKKKKIPYFDFMENEKITIFNTIATAEGALMEAIRNSNINLHGSNCLVIGYGRCGKILASKLKALDTRITITARSQEALSYANAYGNNTIPISDMKDKLSSYDYIFNTVPSLILDKKCLDLVKKEVLIIDIASAPGGVDYDYANKLGINAKLCLGLPGKVAPKSSANQLVSEILKYMKEVIK